MEDPPRLPSGLGVGLLADLIIAWAEGEVSEGWMVDVTDLDRITLRGLKDDAIERALAWGTPIAERRTRATMLAILDDQPPGQREEFFVSSPGWRSIYEAHSRGDDTTGPPSSSP